MATLKKSTKSKYVGVSKCESIKNLKKRWSATFRYNKERYFLGSFFTEEAAACAWDLKAIELSTDINRNFPNLNKNELKEKINKIEEAEKIKSPQRGASRYVGVFCKNPKIQKKWGALITYLKKDYPLGNYYNEEDAARAYDKRAIELYGDKAKRNFPELSYEDISELIYIKQLTNKIHNLGQKLKLPQRENRTFKQLPKASEFLGVGKYSDKYFKKWYANIIYQGNPIFLGTFYSAEDAACFYDKKAKELFGEKAKLNFPNLSEKDLNEKIENIKTKNETGKKEKIIRVSKMRQGKSLIKTKKSRFVGVNLCHEYETKKWRTSICYLGKVYPLGNYDKEEEAALAYDKKVFELNGKKAKLNFPKNQELH